MDWLAAVRRWLHPPEAGRYRVQYYATRKAVPSVLMPNEVAVVGSRRGQKWAFFDCPCGVGHRIQLSLQQSHRPHWRLTVRRGRPSLAPSVWWEKPTGCHFWIDQGRVRWVS